MSNTPLEQWSEIGQQALDSLREMSELNAKTFGNAMGQPFDRGDAAALLKTLADYNAQLSNMQAQMVSGLLHNQLKLLDVDDTAAALQDLTSTSTSFVGSYVQKQMAMASQFTTLFSDYLSGLEKTRSLEDISQLQKKFLDGLETQIKDNSESMTQLLISAKTATTGWTERALNRAIEGQKGQVNPE
jgi:hypothetical protein